MLLILSRRCRHPFSACALTLYYNYCPCTFVAVHRVIEVDLTCLECFRVRRTKRCIADFTAHHRIDFEDARQLHILKSQCTQVNTQYVVQNNCDAVTIVGDGDV